MGAPGAHLVGGADSKAVGAPTLHAQTSNQPALPAISRVHGRTLICPTARRAELQRARAALGSVHSAEAGTQLRVTVAGCPPVGAAGGRADLWDCAQH